MGTGEASTDEKTSKNSAKQCKTVQNSIWRQNEPLQLKIQIFEFKIWISSFLFALLTSNITYMKHLQSVGAGEASTDEKTSKIVQNSAKQAFGRQNEPLQLKIQIFEFKIWISSFLLHY